MARTTKLHHSGMKKLLHSSDVERYLESRARKVLARAEATAPVVTGDYKRGLHLETVQHPSRVVVRVAGSTDHDLAVEADHGTLSRALDAARGA